MNTNNSIFTRVLALMICFIMLVGGLTACFQETDPENNVSTTTTNGGVTTLPTTQPTITTPTTTQPTTTQPTTGTTTGDVVENDPVEDPVDPNVIFSASTTIDASNLILGTLVNDVVIGGEGSTALVPADVMVETNASSLALTLKNVEENDVDLGDVELLNNLDVHISGIAANNTVPMTVALGAILEAGLGATELKLYHIENGTPVLMTRVTSVSDFAIHNQYYYNAETGEVTIYVASFSVFSAVNTTTSKLTADTEADTSWYVGHETATTYTLKDAADFLGFRNLVDTGVTFEGKTVKLGVDIDLNNINFDPIGYGYVHQGGQAFMGTFDGAYHTIYNLYQQGWDLESETSKDYTYSTAGGGLFASIMNATIKNLAVSGAYIKMECVDMGIVVGYAQGTCHFENIVVTNSKIANYQRATGGVVGEVCFGPYETDITKGYSHTFKNITVDSSVTVGSLWGDFDNLTGGVIGGKWGDATVNMENVIVAATLDVYSDVTAAYQWYAYRRCGMLIGHTEQNSPKSALNADAPFLTCNNVTVYYGDWVNYHYYQFANQDSATGQRYPWVRAEQGLNNGAFSNPRYGVPTHSGKPVTELTAAELEEISTGYVLIKFNQLYGGGQGVYGKADHDGVTTIEKNTKTIYFQNNWNWTKLKLHYWFENGEDRWTTVVDGIDVSKLTPVKLGGYDLYTFEVPSYIAGFKIEGYDSTTTTTHSTHEVKANNIVEGNVYWFVYANGEYAIASNKYEPNFKTHDIYVIGSMNNWSTTNIDNKYHLTPSGDGKKWTMSITFDVTTQIKMFNSLVVSEGYGGWINGNGTTDNVELAPGTYTLEYSVADNTFTYTMTSRILYLKPNSNWTKDGARFAVYVWYYSGSTKKEAWYSMTKQSNGEYKVAIPDEYVNVIFCRMNPNASANNWNNKWNQSGDLLTGDGSLFTVPTGNVWDGFTTTWSKK